MNITGALTELPRWSDYYVNEEVSDDYQAQDLDGAQEPETLPEPTPEETAWHLKVRSARLVERALMSKDIRALYDRASATPTVGNKLGPWVVAFERDREFIPKLAQESVFGRVQSAGNRLKKRGQY
ncbi:MAG TPA: hypothetical protein VGO47_07780 [Chlamydiales bacterium]|jgi:hypothetical protein|nr:hypothetical protein [Chlamydiales bacterium]